MKVIALGSSLGDGEAVFAVAERLLQLCGVIILQKSGNHKTKPFGGVAKNDFTNAVWQIETSYSPLALLNLLLSIENSCGRTRDKKWEDHATVGHVMRRVLQFNPTVGYEYTIHQNLGQKDRWRGYDPHPKLQFIRNYHSQFHTPYHQYYLETFAYFPERFQLYLPRF